MTDPAALPFVDEHATTVAADPALVRDALADVVERTFSGRGASAYARLVGCVPATSTGRRPLAVGSTVPGFRVTEADDGRLVLAGRHHFSSYALVLRVEPDGAGRTRLTAETRAAFPGATGRVYRTLVIGSRGHVVGMRRLLAAVRRRAEAARA